MIIKSNDYHTNITNITNAHTKDDSNSKIICMAFYNLSYKLKINLFQSHRTS